MRRKGRNYESAFRYASRIGTVMKVDLHEESSPSLSNRQSYKPTGCDEEGLQYSKITLKAIR